MSTEQSLDPNLIEKTKQQIRSLVNEIAQISKTDITPEEFHTEYLNRIVSSLAAVGGAIWTTDPQGQLGLAYQINMREAKINDEEANRQHARLLYQSMKSPEPLLVPPHSGGEDEAGNPTEYLLLLGPVRTELETVGMVEILQRRGAGPSTQKGYLRFLNQMCGLMSDYYKNRQLRHFGDRQTLWAQLEEFTRTIHSSLNLRETAYTIVNEGRRLIECDRVTIALRRGRKCTVEAVSGQAMLDKRSNTVRLLGRLATAVVASNEPVWYTGDTADMAPQVEDAVEEYVDESHTKMVAVFPLSQIVNNEEEQEDDPKKREEPDPPFGALIIEQIEDNRVPEKMQKRIEIVAEHSCSALGNAMDYNSVFLMPLWRLIGKSKVLVKARMLPKTITVTAAILAFFIAMCVVPWDFEMHSDGSLEPVTRQNVYAAGDGKVMDLFVAHESEVKGPDPVTGQPGTVLARMRNTDLEVKLREVEGEIQKNLEQRSTIKHMLSELRGGSANEKRRQLEGELVQLEEDYKTLLARQELFREKLAELEVRAPIDGEVVTWDLEDRLLDRPVVKGQALMEIADPSGRWQAELLMPEKRMGHIVEYFKQQRAEDPEFELKVEIVLATDPDTTHYGTIKQIHQRAEVRGQEGNTVLLKVSLDDQEKLPESLRPGAGVSAKVYCGKKPVGYVLLHEAIAYVQKNIIFWF